MNLKCAFMPFEAPRLVITYRDKSGGKTEREVIVVEVTDKHICALDTKKWGLRTFLYSGIEEYRWKS